MRKDNELFKYANKKNKHSIYVDCGIILVVATLIIYAVKAFI